MRTEPSAETTTEDVLDNPAWHALEGPQASVARNAPLAARYEPEVSPIGAISERTPAALSDLADLAVVRDVVVLFVAAEELPEHPAWRQAASMTATQMVWRSPSTLAAIEGEPLVAADVSAMTALVQATDPGPFGPRTIELGNYLGVREQGDLLAMAGERFRPPGFTEVSAVCTDERARGRGYAGGLVSALVERIRARDEVPFLHVRDGSPSEMTAKALYERCGFRERRAMPYTILLRK
jgi:ribosomal protein S18 acetylase RimI-like enzyme